MIRVAIHDRPRSFSGRWAEYCDTHGVPYALVNGYASDIVAQMREYDAFLWHFSHGNPTDLLIARSVLSSLEHMGKRVFPDHATCWHFDDKIAQKYLLESVDAPLVPAFVTYDRDRALEWCERAEFPKVFKLRRGAGSQNVRLVRDREAARQLIRRSFGRGWKAAPSIMADWSTKLRKHQRNRSFGSVLKRLGETRKGLRIGNAIPRERGYVYFQDFMPGNTRDTRITVIGRRAFGFTRGVRKNDFRASGSGNLNYDLSLVDERCVSLAFDVARRLNSQSVAFDIIMSPEGQPCIVEISFGYLSSAVQACKGHWDEDLNWHEGSMYPEDAILEDLLQS